MITSRSYSSPADYDHMHALVGRIYALTGPPVYCTLGDLDWWRFPHDDEGGTVDARLWFEANGELAGFAWPSGNQVDLNIHPDYAALADEMLDWAEGHRLSSKPADSSTQMLTAWAFENDHERQSQLIARGYERTGFVFYHRAGPLDASIQTVSLPYGYALNHMTDELVESRVDAHRDAFSPSKMTVQKYRTLKQAPTYRPETDLVALDANGEVAAFALVWFDASNCAGSFEPVGTRLSDRGHGLARALMYEGMNRLRALGATTALVVSNGNGDASNRLYDSVGMPVIGRNEAWRKALDVQ